MCRVASPFLVVHRSLDGIRSLFVSILRMPSPVPWRGSASSSSSSSSSLFSGTCKTCAALATAEADTSRVRCQSPRRKDLAARNCLPLAETLLGAPSTVGEGWGGWGGGGGGQQDTVQSSCVMFLEVSLDAQAYTAQKMTLRVSTSLLISEISLSSAPFAGGGRVTVRGRGFQDALSLTCRFGPHAFVPGNYGDGIQVYIIVCVRKRERVCMCVCVYSVL